MQGRARDVWVERGLREGSASWTSGSGSILATAHLASQISHSMGYPCVRNPYTTMHGTVQPPPPPPAGYSHSAPAAPASSLNGVA